jgi:hypothetical protein
MTKLQTKIFDFGDCSIVPHGSQPAKGYCTFFLFCFATNKCCPYLKYLFEFAKLGFQLAVVLLQNDHSSLQPDHYLIVTSTETPSKL